ncbi:MAG: glycosyltransferase [Bacteroidota bacterium]
MKLLIIGASESWSLETFYLKYLKEIPDLEVEILSTSEFGKKHYRKLIDRVLIRLFRSKNPYYDKLNKHILSETLKYAPDVVLVFKGMELYPETLKAIKSSGIFLTNYNPDHPFIITMRGSGNQNVTQSVPLYDLHFSYSKDLMARFEKEYHIPSVYLPFGFELSEIEFNKLEIQDEISKICFIGNPDEIRVKTIIFLLNEGFNIDVYGIDWGKYIDPKLFSGLNIFNAIFGTQFWSVARSYRVQLNIFRPHNVGSHNMRTFEIPAVGGIMLAPDSPEHRAFFEDDKEAFFYENAAEMVQKAKEILEMPLAEAELIRKNARAKSLAAHYDYRSRAQIIYRGVRSLI